MKSVITIGRQFGSGGREVGKRLADALGIPFYDKEIITQAAKDSGICEEIIEQHDEKPVRSLLYSLVTGISYSHDASAMYMDMPINHRIFLAQFDAMRTIASKGPCVIVGRCADYVLRDQENVINVFVKADMEFRIERAISRGIDPYRAEEHVRRADKERASYYNYYAAGTWGDIKNYDLSVDTGRIGVEGAVELLKTYIAIRESVR